MLQAGPICAGNGTFGRHGGFPHRQCLASGVDIVHAQDLDTLGSAEERGGDRSRQAIGGLGTREMADEAFARGAKQHRAAEAMEDAEGTDNR